MLTLKRIERRETQFAASDTKSGKFSFFYWWPRSNPAKRKCARTCHKHACVSKTTLLINKRRDSSLSNVKNSSFRQTVVSVLEKFELTWSDATKKQSKAPIAIVFVK